MNEILRSCSKMEIAMFVILRGIILSVSERQSIGIKKEDVLPDKTMNNLGLIPQYLIIIISRLKLKLNIFIEIRNSVLWRDKSISEIIKSLISEIPEEKIRVCLTEIDKATIEEILLQQKEK